MLEKQRKEQHKRERNELREEKARVASVYDPETMEDEHTTITSPPVELSAVHVGPADSAVIAQPRIAHALAHDISHGEPVSWCFVMYKNSVDLRNVCSSSALLAPVM